MTSTERLVQKVFRRIRKDFIRMAEMDLKTNDPKYYIDRIQALVPGFPRGTFEVRTHWMDKSYVSKQNLLIFVEHTNANTYPFEHQHVCIGIRKAKDDLYHPYSCVDSTQKCRIDAYMKEGDSNTPSSIKELYLCVRDIHRMYPGGRHLVRDGSTFKHDPEKDIHDVLEFDSIEEALNFRALPRTARLFEYSMRTGNDPE